MCMRILHLIIALIFITSLASCKKKDSEEVITTSPTPEVCSPSYSFNGGSSAGPRLVFKFKFDSTQTRLNNIGQPSTIPPGHAAQSPIFRLMSQHYIELAGDLDMLGAGQVLFVGAETNAGGPNAINYCASTITGNDEIFFSKPLSEIPIGSYKWLRVSLAYQNYDILYKSSLLPGNQIGMGTIASFLGFRTYVNSYDMNGTLYTPGTNAGGPGNHDQGYWGFVTSFLGTHYFTDGQAPAGATTVPNPFVTSSIPPGSCVVTGQFVNNAMMNSPLQITGSESQDIVITVSLSINKSFEWIEVNADNYFQPEIGEAVVDMGIRGLIPIKN